MSLPRALFACSLVAIACLARGQEPQPEPAPEPARAKPARPGPRDIEARFLDGSTLKATVVEELLEIETRYGRLVVPCAEVRRIEFGLRLSAEETRAVEAALKQLGADDFKQREEGTRRLTALGEKAVPATRRAARNPDLEIAKRAKGVLETLDEILSDEQMSVRDQDQVQTADFPVVGRVQNPTLKVRTAYFGEQALKLSELRSVQTRSGTGSGELTVDAAQYATQGAWMATDVEVSASSKLSATVSGQVDLWPETPGQYMSGPDGFQQGRFVGRAPAARQAGGELMGRVGPQGKPFLIGSKYEGRPGEAGKLYLHIVPSPWGNASTGAYSVKVILQGE